MSILKEVLAELFSMFVADAWLTAGILGVVALAALIGATLSPIVGGLVLLAGCIAVFFVSVRQEAARRRKAG